MLLYCGLGKETRVVLYEYYLKLWHIIFHPKHKYPENRDRCCWACIFYTNNYLSIDEFLRARLLKMSGFLIPKLVLPSVRSGRRCTGVGNPIVTTNVSSINRTSDNSDKVAKKCVSNSLLVAIYIIAIIVWHAYAYK